MNWISRLFWLLLLVAAFILALLSVNQQQVALKLLDWQTPELSVFWWLLIALVSGLSLGLIPVLVNSAKHVLVVRRLNKEMKAKVKEIDQLREMKSSAEQLAAQQQLAADPG